MKKNKKNENIESLLNLPADEQLDIVMQQMDDAPRGSQKTDNKNEDLNNLL
ncbi:hypothetical protein [Peribacillus kribbensis]|uniref:hypothetical protein n=1 Tax=Peribacillus kribbensis TaxID=356658 RepID=UPI00041CA8A3|nr:hypothetical protein [Peribacillus kribbensis]